MLPGSGCFGGSPYWHCFWCEVVAILVSVAACIVIIYATYGTGGELCAYILEMFHLTENGKI